MLLARKKNMTQTFGASKKVIPVTVLDYSECTLITGQKTSGKFIGLGKKQKPGKTETGKFGEIVPLFSVKVSDEIESLEDLIAGDKVDVIGTSKGKGFAGVIKMWGFHGLDATHGQKHKARHGGSIGNRTTPGRVWVGKKMPRRKGGERQTVKRLEIVSVDTENKLICVKGSVPGTYNSILQIVKR